MDVAALIFDFDGLIIDSETPLFDIWSEIYAEHGETLTLADWQHALGTQGGFDPYGHLSARADLAPRAEYQSRVRAEHWRRCEAQPLLPGVAEYLDAAPTLGLKLAVASSSPSWWVGPWLDRHALRDRFASVCTRDDVAAVKPAPDLFLLAAERLETSPAECVVIEDSPNGVRAAQAAGMRVVAVTAGLTATLPLPEPDVRLTALSDLPLTTLLERLSRAS